LCSLDWLLEQYFHHPIADQFALFCGQALFLKGSLYLFQYPAQVK
jgi:hypothetical protein